MSAATVSYTHLDVYKRQVLQSRSEIKILKYYLDGMKNYKLGTERGICPFSASAERQKKFLVKLFIKSLWVKR